MANKIRHIYILLVAAYVCHLSIDIFMLNTGDYDRAITPFMNGIRQFTTNDSLAYPMFSLFHGLLSYEYKSAFSFILYGYASFISLFTHIFDLRIWSAANKIAYIFIIYFLYLKFFNSHKTLITILFPMVAVILLTPSILSQFSSFYQDQIIISLLPLSIILSLTVKNSKLSFYSLVLVSLIIATSKSQFFYFPILISIAFLIFFRERSIKFHTPFFVSVVIGILCIIHSPSATKSNNYHSLYFGALLYNKMHNLEIPDWADYDCIGIDAWGNAFDLEKGAISTKIANQCRENNNGQGIKESLKIYLSNPATLIKLPFDQAVKGQLTEDYFHVYKSIKLIQGDAKILKAVENLKEKTLKHIRLILCVVSLIASIIFHKRYFSMPIFILSSFSLSQFYISFLGEGYRDLNRHLFSMNYSSDLLFFTLVCLLASFLINLFNKKTETGKS